MNKPNVQQLINHYLGQEDGIKDWSYVCCAAGYVDRLMRGVDGEPVAKLAKFLDISRSQADVISYDRGAPWSDEPMQPKERRDHVVHALQELLKTGVFKWPPRAGFSATQGG